MNTRFFSCRGPALSRVFGICAALGLTFAVLVMAAQAVPARKASQSAAPAGRIMLAPAPDAKGEMPPVPFDHDVHTKAMRASGKDCATCHKPVSRDGQEGLSFAFKNTRETSSRDAKELFHDACISCHTQQEKAGKKSGPLEAQCRSCHVPAQAPEGKRFMPAFDKSLHYRHIESPDIKAPEGDGKTMNASNCAACHHPVPGLSPDQVTRDSCRSCHKPFGPQAHDSCVSCHLNVAKTKKPTGPVDCSGCHNSATWNKYAKLSQVPQLPAGQPRARLVTPATDGTKAQDAQGSMPPVPFNHSLHEKALPSCRSCHHDTIQSCSTCHTLAGTPQGKGVTQSQAMHKADSAYSCVGCHEQRKNTLPQCAGCHTSKAPAAVKPDCAFCHKPLSGKSAAPKAPGAPEAVVIGGLSNEYEPSIMPHGAIIKALEKGIQTASPSLLPLHEKDYTLCQSCHHNSPAGPTPPKCASCHDKAAPGNSNVSANGRLPLRTAYHQQCMGCHQRMQIKKPADTDCVACHAKKTTKKK